MGTFEKQAIATSLKSMFNGNHFSICDFDQCCKIAKITPDKSTYDVLHALHCVNWTDMDSEFRREVKVKGLAVFSEGNEEDMDLIIDAALNVGGAREKISELLSSNQDDRKANSSSMLNRLLLSFKS